MPNRLGASEVKAGGRSRDQAPRITDRFRLVCLRRTSFDRGSMRRSGRLAFRMRGGDTVHGDRCDGGMRDERG
eukprot:scaffold314446_cov30-Tisochrysis_lutea.AAC.2